MRRLALLLALSFAAATAPALATPAPAERYALVIDAGSSGSRLYVYQWRDDAGDGVPEIHTAPHPRPAGALPWELRTGIDLDSLVAEPATAVEAVEPLLVFAEDRLAPLTDLSTVPLWLYATGGLRQLEPAVREPLLAALAERLAAAPFDFREARVISGEEEALYGWIAVNALMGLLGRGGTFPTVGVLDLGGASSQVAFVPLDLPRQSGRTLELGGDRYPVYVESYPGQGQDVLRHEVGSRDCWPVGFSVPEEEGGPGTGTGDWYACKAAIRRTIAADCPEGADPCSLMGEYQPPLHGEFVAVSTYAYTAEFFDLHERLTPLALERAGNGFCSTPWERTLERRPGAAEDPYLPRYCFAAAYVGTLLTEGFGFPVTTERIAAPRRIQGSEASWALGALVWELGR